ncbi:transporter [Methylopila sp. M107]|uniref:transporter n=1 Tax=Methylopila sp. M107 TaxID=1101190 RepID=UPI00035D28CB|nr:transporter [Methylopila sp. M107]
MSVKLLRKSLALGALALGLALPGSANAIDIIPGDYTAMPSGTTLGLLYFGFSDNSNLRINNTKIPDSKYSVATVIPRILHYSEIAGVPIAIQAFIPVGKFTDHKVGGFDAEKNNGVGDLVGGFTVFGLTGADKPGGTTAGLTGYVSAPTGKYDIDRPFNIGSGTWTFFPQLGVIQNLGNGFFLDLAADVTFYKDFRDDHALFGGSKVKIKQNETYQLQGYLRYNFSPATYIATGYNGRFGGAQSIEGVRTGLKTDSDGLRAFAGTFITPTIQLTAVAGVDVSRAKGGFRNDFTGQIRLLKLFAPQPASPVLVTKY